MVLWWIDQAASAVINGESLASEYKPPATDADIERSDVRRDSRYCARITAH